MSMRSISLPLLAALALGAAQAQRLQVEPAADVVVGTPLALRVAELAPGATVTLRSDRAARDWRGQPVLYRAEARFVADAAGRIDLAQAAPAAGSYQSADVQGLFWSASAVHAPIPAGLGESQVQLSVRDGERELTALTLTLRRQHAQLQLTPVPEFPGAVLARLPGSVPRPALIALGGSEGGSLAVGRGAALLASQGFAVLALPYYSPGGWGPNGPTPPELPMLPAAFADIPLERLEQARDWLQQQPGIAGDRIGLHGVSKGAELALLAAVRMPWIRSVVAVVPSDVSWEGWGPGVEPGRRGSFAWRGQPLPFVPYQGFAQEMQGFSNGAGVRFLRPHEAGRAAFPQAVAAARIPVEDYAGPLLVIGGGDDQVWASGTMAQAIAARRQAAGRETLALVYPEAGHALSGPGWSPTTAYNAGPMKTGGQPAADGRAVADAWPKTINFLRRTLAPVPE